MPSKSYHRNELRKQNGNLYKRSGERHPQSRILDNNMKNCNSFFITVEGIDGCGKTTMSKYISSLLTDANVDNIWTREPGGSAVAEAIRTIVLDPDFEIDLDTELMLFMSARCDHLAHKIKPALVQGKWVICDRYMDSTLAYQCTDIDEMWDTQEWAYRLNWMLMPDITFYLKIDADTAHRRMSARNCGNDDRIEMQFHSRVENMIKMYNEMENEYHHYITIDANGNENDVKDQIDTQIKYILSL